MSTQDDSGIPISIVNESAEDNYRLLELPPDLLRILTSDNAPTLHLKSRDPEHGIANDANVVLCTPDKTYQIRQVSTSNSVYVARPHEVSSTDVKGPPQLGIEAICKCESTIELLSSPTVPATTYIRMILPVFLSTGHYSSQKSVSRDQLFSDIPLSQAECEQGWADLSCFESEHPAGCFIPSAKVRMQVWQAILTTAIAAGVDLTTAYPGIGLPHYLSDLKLDWPTTVITAILRSVSTREVDGDLAVNEERCVRFVGLNHLEAQSEGRAVETAVFLQTWKDSVPEKWRDKCQLSILEGAYTPSDDGRSITFRSGADTTQSTLAASAAKTSIGAKRKWHEKFRPTKKS